MFEIGERVNCRKFRHVTSNTPNGRVVKKPAYQRTGILKSITGDRASVEFKTSMGLEIRHVNLSDLSKVEE